MEIGYSGTANLLGVGIEIQEVEKLSFDFL